jgi:hypothetical protein
MILKYKNKSLQLRDNLFWDVPNIEAGKNDLLIIERVVKRGNKQEFADIVSFYDINSIKVMLLQIKGFDNRTLNFLSKYFHIKKDQLHAK